MRECVRACVRMKSMGERKRSWAFHLHSWWFKVLMGFRGRMSSRGGMLSLPDARRRMECRGRPLHGLYGIMGIGALVVVGVVWENVKTQRESKDMGILDG